MALSDIVELAELAPADIVVEPDTVGLAIEPAVEAEHKSSVPELSAVEYFVVPKNFAYKTTFYYLIYIKSCFVDLLRVF